MSDTAAAVIVITGTVLFVLGAYGVIGTAGLTRQVPEWRPMLRWSAVLAACGANLFALGIVLWP